MSTSEAGAHHLAQVNVGRLAAPIDSAQLQTFVDLLAPVNAAADEAPGFVWRLQTDEGNATSVVAFAWDSTSADAGVIVNMSVWRDVESLLAYVYGDAHRAVLRRRREWFLPMTEAYVACWWLPAGELPTVADAELRVRHLRAHGPGTYAFTPRDPFPAT